MPKTVEPSLSWEEAPDMITPNHLGKILGVSTKKANEIFNSKGFPKISNLEAKKVAYKITVAKFLGFNIRKADTKDENNDLMRALEDILYELRMKNGMYDYRKFRKGEIA